MQVIRIRPPVKGKAIPIKKNTHSRKKTLTTDEKSYILKEEIKDEPKETRIDEPSERVSVKDETKIIKSDGDDDTRFDTTKRTRKSRKEYKQKIEE